MTDDGDSVRRLRHYRTESRKPAERGGGGGEKKEIMK